MGTLEWSKLCAFAGKLLDLIHSRFQKSALPDFGWFLCILDFVFQCPFGRSSVGIARQMFAETTLEFHWLGLLNSVFQQFSIECFLETLTLSVWQGISRLFGVSQRWEGAGSGTTMSECSCTSRGNGAGGS